LSAEHRSLTKTNPIASFLNRLFGHVGALFAFAIIEMVVWQSLALTGNDTAIIVASGHAIIRSLRSYGRKARSSTARLDSACWRLEHR
jgi:hypothetical protein